MLVARLKEGILIRATQKWENYLIQLETGEIIMVLSYEQTKNSWFFTALCCSGTIHNFGGPDTDPFQNNFEIVNFETTEKNNA